MDEVTFGTKKEEKITLGQWPTLITGWTSEKNIAGGDFLAGGGKTRLLLRDEVCDFSGVKGSRGGLDWKWGAGSRK